MKAKNPNSMNVYIDEKGQLHSISFAIKKAVKSHLTELESEIKKLKRDESETHTTMRGMITAIERDNKEQQIKGWNACLEDVLAKIALMKEKV